MLSGLQIKFRLKLKIFFLKTKILNLRIDPDLKKKAKKIAEEDGRTLSNWVTRLIEREVAKARKGGK